MDITLRDKIAISMIKILREELLYDDASEWAEAIGISEEDWDGYEHFPELIAKLAYQQADAMIEERNK